MSTIAEQLIKVNDCKQAIRGAIEAKGVSVGNAPLSDYAGKIEEISGGGGGGGDVSRFGLDLDFFGINQDGTLITASKNYTVDLTGIKIISQDVLQYAFYFSKQVNSFVAPDLTRIEETGCAHTFDSSFVGGEVNLPKLAYIDVYGANYMFASTGITKFSAAKLSEIAGNGAKFMFQYCTTLTEVDLSSLMKLGANACSGMFQQTGLKTISFPALYSVQSNSFGRQGQYIFADCADLTEIHFAKAAQSQIESMMGYDEQWGADNATIYFDL